MRAGEARAGLARRGVGRCAVAILGAALTVAACGSSASSQSDPTTAALASLATAPGGLRVPTTKAVRRDASGKLMPASVVSSPATTAAKSGSRSGSGASDGHGSPGTTAAPGVALHAANVTWTASPATVTVAAGGHAAGFVFAKNLDPIAGTVVSPGCPVLSTTGVVHLPPKACPPAGRVVVLSAFRKRKWEWVWNATTDGVSTSPPIAPGTYTLSIGGATVAVTVTP